MNLTQDQLQIAELGKPRLGEFRKCQVTIKESKEFQVGPASLLTFTGIGLTTSDTSISGEWGSEMVV